jgi:hypothetical protein
VVLHHAVEHSAPATSPQALELPVHLLLQLARTYAYTYAPRPRATTARRPAGAAESCPPPQACRRPEPPLLRLLRLLRLWRVRHDVLRADQRAAGTGQAHSDCAPELLHSHRFWHAGAPPASTAAAYGLNCASATSIHARESPVCCSMSDSSASSKSVLPPRCKALPLPHLCLVHPCASFRRAVLRRSEAGARVQSSAARRSEASKALRGCAWRCAAAASRLAAGALRARDRHEEP